MKNKIRKFFKNLKELLLFNLGDIFNYMPVRIGPFDPLNLIFQIMNVLMKNGQISGEEAKEIIRRSLPKEMPDEEKEKLINLLIVKVDSPKQNGKK